MNSRDALKFVWAYMLEQGRETTGEWNYYGGRWDYGAAKVQPAWIAKQYPGKFVEKEWREADESHKELLELIKQVGIDWDKTQPPESSQQSEFNGTFNESSHIEALLGKLVLKDGSETLIGVKNAEVRFKGYLEFLTNLMEDEERVKRILGEL